MGLYREVPVFAKERSGAVVARLLGGQKLPPARAAAIDDASTVDLHIAAQRTHAL